MASTKDVLNHHVKCFGAGDLAGILSDYPPDAVPFTPDGPLKGVGAIRPLFQAMLAEFGKPGTAFSMKHSRSLSQPECAAALTHASSKPLVKPDRRCGCRISLTSSVKPQIGV